MNESATSPAPRKMFALRIRYDDQSPWGPPAFYRTRRERDKVAAFNRILGGIRTHSYEEKRVPEDDE